LNRSGVMVGFGCYLSVYFNHGPKQVRQLITLVE